MEVLQKNKLRRSSSIGAVRLDKSLRALAPPMQSINLELTLEKSPRALLLSDRLDIWQRDVPWSPAKQLRSVLETELSLDDVFDYEVSRLRVNELQENARRHAPSEAIKTAASVPVFPFFCTGQSSATSLSYRVLPFPWFVLASLLQCIVLVTKTRIQLTGHEYFQS